MGKVIKPPPTPIIAEAIPTTKPPAARIHDENGSAARHHVFIKLHHRRHVDSLQLAAYGRNLQGTRDSRAIMVTVAVSGRLLA